MNALNEFLALHHYTLEHSKGGLTGSGADFLHARAQESRFMLIGEEHGVGSTVDLTTALFRLIAPLGYKNYVTEVGPISAEYLNHLLREADARSAFEAFFRKYPFSAGLPPVNKSFCRGFR